MKKFVSNCVDCSRVSATKFNILHSGTGTGKTYFVANYLLSSFPDILPHEVIFVTSRALTVEQQIKEENINKYNPHNGSHLNHWNGGKDLGIYLQRKGIQAMTYDKIIDIINKRNQEGYKTLDKVKMIIFDECHCLFSDEFIKDIGSLKVWIRDTLYEGQKILIGMTATIEIINHYKQGWGVTINQINDEPIVNYKAKQLHCTDFDTIPYIITTNKVIGKTIIMCVRVDDCYTLKDKIPNSAILISKRNPRYLPEMDLIRDYIVDNEVLPETYLEVTKRDDKTKQPIEYTEKKLEVLITTSTLREGINLREGSGVRNVISCFSDELHVIQFMGRCRYSVDNLIVADTYVRSDNYNRDAYLTKERNKFKDYLKHRNNVAWFDTISHIVEHGFYDIKTCILTSYEKDFINYINSKWLVPHDIEDKEKYKIYKEEDKNEIVKKVIDCKLLDIHPSRITFNKAINVMEKDFGYEIESNRMRVDKKQYTYKLIIDFDEQKITYKPPKSKYELEEGNVDE